MEVRDRFDLPITSASAEAVDDYAAGVDLLRSGQPNKAAPLLRSRLVRRPSARDEVWLELSSDAANGG